MTRLLCADPELASADQKMRAQISLLSKELSGTAFNRVLEDQQQWANQTAQDCYLDRATDLTEVPLETVNCVRTLYASREGEIEAPQATSDLAETARILDLSSQQAIFIALQTVRAGQQYWWRDRVTGSTLEVTPQPTYLDGNGQTCRAFTYKITPIGADPRVGQGLGCRRPNVDWQIE
jgi:surface antigen